MLTILNPKKENKFSKLIIVSFLIAVVFFSALTTKRPELARINIYRLYRSFNCKYLDFKLADWNELQGNFFKVKYQDGDQSAAEIVLNQAEEVYGQLTRRYKLDRLPLPLTVIVYPSSEELSFSFGWPVEERALGAYQAGSIRLLSPAVYQGGNDIGETESIYRKYGPFVHEFTHLLIDYKAQANYPRWFTEGLAQYEEYRTNDLVWAQKGENWYSLKQLTGDSFDQIEDQTGAYWQSLVMVKDLIANYGWDYMEAFLNELSTGVSFESAFSKRFGVDLWCWETEIRDRLW
jgi:hypothetical protein